jgi:hypothetical protein
MIFLTNGGQKMKRTLFAMTLMLLLAMSAMAIAGYHDTGGDRHDSVSVQHEHHDGCGHCVANLDGAQADTVDGVNVAMRDNGAGQRDNHHGISRMHQDYTEYDPKNRTRVIWYNSAAH